MHRILDKEAGALSRAHAFCFCIRGGARLTRLRSFERFHVLSKLNHMILLKSWRGALLAAILYDVHHTRGGVRFTGTAQHVWFFL